jgi:ABC-type lipoprotein export system ATPase subunit
VIVVTHDVRVASQADRVVILLDGQITYDGQPGSDVELMAALKLECER